MSDEALPAVALATTGSAGDVLPLLAIGRRLIESGHEVALVTHAPYRERAEKAGLRFVALDTEEDYEALLSDSARLVGSNHDLDLAERATGWFHSEERKSREFTAVLDFVAGREAVVVGRHLSATPAMSAAEITGTPRAWALMSPHAVPEATATQELHGAAKLLALNTDRALFGLPPVTNWLAWTKTAARLALWPPWFTPEWDSGQSLLLTGFPCDPSEVSPLTPKVQDFLAAGDPPVLVTGGTGRMLLPAFFDAAVAGALRTGSRSIVVNEYLPHPLHWAKDRVLVLPRTSMPAILRHVKAVAHHGGIGTSARAMECGVPQVVLAEGVDRPDNAARLRRLGLAIDLPGTAWTGARIAESLRFLEKDPSVRRATEKAAALLRQEDAAVRAARTVSERPWIRQPGTDGQPRPPGRGRGTAPIARNE